MTEKIILKDSVTKILCNTRLRIFKNTKKTYQLQKDFFRLIIIDANMKRMHLDSMILQIEKLIKMQDDQINKKYSEEKEININTLSQKINEGDWTDSEKETIMFREKKLLTLQTQISKLMIEIENDGDNLVTYQGTEIIGTIRE
jgi:hypothetical protein